MATSLFGAVDRAARSDCQAPGETASTVTGTGQGTYLGEFQIILHICSLASGWKDGEAVFTAANGDALRLRYAARLMRPGTVSEFESRWRVLGGTGQFASIIGEGRVVGSVDLVSGGGRAIWEGELAGSGSVAAAPKAVGQQVRKPVVSS